MLVVAFSGKKDAGKDTGANVLASHYLKAYSPRFKPQVLGFSYPLKKFCAQWFGLSTRKLYGTDEDKNEHTHLKWEDIPHLVSAEGYYQGPMTYREVLQILGTDFFRRLDPDCHIRRWKQEMEELRRKDTPLVLISDVRFPNEIDAILEVGGPLARVVRLTRYPHEDDVHASETALDDYSWSQDPRLHVLDNTGTLAEYKRDLIRWFEHTYREELEFHG